jgi:hypothetical protein
VLLPPKACQASCSVWDIELDDRECDAESVDKVLLRNAFVSNELTIR